MPKIKKCGNCGRFIPDSDLIKEMKKKNQVIYVYKGKCSASGKNTNPKLLAGCLLWREITVLIK